MNTRIAAPRRGPFRVALLLAGSALLLAACGPNGSASPQHTVTVTKPAGSGGSGAGAGSPSPTPTQASGGEPGIVAVTTAGALVVLNPANGSVTQTLVPSGVTGDEISVSPDGQSVYFTEVAGCHSEVESVSISGQNLTAIAPGQLPAISPDGTKLAYTTEPVQTDKCFLNPTKPSVTDLYKIVVKTLNSGTVQDIGLPAEVIKSQLLPPISHLSWSSDGTAIAVSTSTVEDNEGWNLAVLTLASAKYYAGTEGGITNIPVTGSPTPQRSYIMEGVFLPDGNFFVSRACCGGVPVRNTSRLMWEVDVNGNLIHQVAIGYPNLEHDSLAVNPTGQWLLYIGGTDLYVSQGGSRPTDVAHGLIAATWS